MKQLIAVPFYNRADDLKSSLSKLYKCISSDTEIFLIDDGSDDGSRDMELDEGVHYIHHEKPLGYGGCVISALDFAAERDSDQLVLLDIFHDNFDDVYLQMNEYSEAYDILNCSRLAPRKENIFSDDDYNNIILSNQITDKVNNVTGYKLDDLFSPFKSLKMSSIDKMTLEEFDEAIVIQLFIQAAHFGLSVKEYFSEHAAIDGFNEQANLENDIDYYLNFIEGEKILYPPQQ